GKMHSERNICLDVQWLDGELLERGRVRLHRSRPVDCGLTMPRIFSTLLNREVDVSADELERRRRAYAEREQRRRAPAAPASEPKKEEPQPGPTFVEVEVVARDAAG